MLQEISFINNQHANQLKEQQYQQQLQRDEHEEEVRSLRDQVRLLQDSIVVLNRELGHATASLHSVLPQQRSSFSPQSLPSDEAADQASIPTLRDAAGVAELRALLAVKDREFRSVKGVLSAPLKLFMICIP
jgi:hypothetical protein